MIKANYDSGKMNIRYFAEKNLPVFFITKKMKKKNPGVLCIFLNTHVQETPERTFRKVTEQKKK